MITVLRLTVVIDDITIILVLKGNAICEDYLHNVMVKFPVADADAIEGCVAVDEFDPCSVTLPLQGIICPSEID